jgi:transposase
MNDQTLVAALRIAESPGVSERTRQLPDWSVIEQELKKKGVTLQLLWEEYKGHYSEGYQLSQFCKYYRTWKRSIDVTMRQTHKAGEKLFVDYAGQTVPVYDAKTGAVSCSAAIFVAVLGASNYTFAEATESQALPQWLSSHVRAFEYFGGVSEITVPDNLKSGVIKACAYEPDINPSYHDLALHYGTTIIPARVRKPKDKAKVENGVLIVSRWILAVVRHRKFFSLAELNEAIAQLLERLNSRPFKKLPGTRRSLFETLEKSLLKPLPITRYVFAEWKKARVNIDYHVDVDGHYYSVSYTAAREYVEVRFTAATIEIFLRGNRIASHMRSYHKNRHTTIREHMPKSHQRYAEWSPSRIIQWAGTIGVSAAQLVEIIMETRRHPELGYRSCMGIMRLGKRYGNDRLEAACARALSIRAFSYKSVHSILKNGLDRERIPSPTISENLSHENIRGKNYFTTNTLS